MPRHRTREIAKVFRALAHPTRMRVLEELDGWAARSGTLADRFDCAWPTLSKHLKVLRDAGLIETTESELGGAPIYVRSARGIDEAFSWLKDLHAGRFAP